MLIGHLERRKISAYDYWVLRDRKSSYSHYVMIIFSKPLLQRVTNAFSSTCFHSLSSIELSRKQYFDILKHTNKGEDHLKTECAKVKTTASLLYKIVTQYVRCDCKD